MAKNDKLTSWRIMTTMIMDAARKDPQVLQYIYEDAEFRPKRNANVWSQLSAVLAKERKAYRDAVAGKSLKDVQHTMLRRCFAHDYSNPGSYMVTLVVPGGSPHGAAAEGCRPGCCACKPLYQRYGEGCPQCRANDGHELYTPDKGRLHRALHSYKE